MQKPQDIELSLCISISSSLAQTTSMLESSEEGEKRKATGCQARASTVSLETSVATSDAWLLMLKETSKEASKEAVSLIPDLGRLKLNYTVKPCLKQLKTKALVV